MLIICLLVVAATLAAIGTRPSGSPRLTALGVLIVALILLSARVGFLDWLKQ